MKAVELISLVNLAIGRREGASSSNYWGMDTVLELACLNNDWVVAKHILPRALYMVRESWMTGTAGFLAAQREGDPRKRVLVINPDENTEYIHLLN